MRPEGGILQVAAPAAPAGREAAWRRVPKAILAWCEANQLGGLRAAGVGAGLGATAGACFAIGHPGFAGVVGLVAASFLWVADGAEGPRARLAAPLVSLLAGASDLAVLGGIALAAAGRGSAGGVLLPVAAVGLLLLGARIAGGPGPRTEGPLWSAHESRLVLLGSAALGHLALPLLWILAVGGLELTARILRLAGGLGQPPRAKPLPPWLEALSPRGRRPAAGVRVALALLVVALLVLLPTEAGWAF